MDVRFSSFNFPSTENDGPQTANANVSFPRQVLRAAVGITGYSATYDNRDDHHLGRFMVELDASINGGDSTKVDVSGRFGLRDWSGEWDDPYSGIVEYAVFAELVPAIPPAPGAARGDLIIVDAEVVQTTQHFRSQLHLDSANVFPNNSVRLVAAKPTAVRLYVDYDASSGLAAIARLSGELRVTVAGATTTLAPLRSIAPRRDGSIDRGQRDHTLNFVIPENLCEGTVEISARVFSASDSTQFSGDFVKTLTFETMPALPVMAVGIEYTGSDVSNPAALAAPTMADFVSLFGFTEAVYPIPAVAITSYVTMTYDRDVKSDIGEGCDKIGDLRDAVADLRGDSDDIVYGLFNSGLDTGSVGGCGGDGVAVGRIGAQDIAAHEIGHALGRKHAPCDNATRCAEPKNTDGDYPDYVGFDSDSIGEYGFDTRAVLGSVRQPATAHDMMGYSGGRWISPYTYKALMSRIPETFAGADARARAAALVEGAPTENGCWIRIKQPQLFLRLEIHRHRSIDFETAFHFDAGPRPHGPEKTNFEIELVDRQGTVLRRSCLYGESAGCGCCAGSGGPVKIRHAVPFDLKARELVLYEGEKELRRWPIGERPKVAIAVTGQNDAEQAEVEVCWQILGQQDGAREHWYLVQWRDRNGTWRGAAPRTRRTSLKIEKRLLRGEGRVAAVRVLASSGIATGVAIWEGALDPSPPDQRPPGFAIAGAHARAAGAYELPRVLRASALTADAAALPRAALRWYDARGAEIGRGRSLDLSGLEPGQHQITLVANRDSRASTCWLVERTPEGRFLLLVGDQKARLSPRRYAPQRQDESEE